jgi:hypothetical protein
VAAAQLLLGRQAWTDAKDAGGQTALMYAANNGQLEMVQLLLASQAQVNVWDRNGQSALSYARLQGHREIEQALKAAGAAEAPPKPIARPRAPVRRKKR